MNLTNQRITQLLNHGPRRQARDFRILHNYGVINALLVAYNFGIWPACSSAGRAVSVPNALDTSVIIFCTCYSTYYQQPRLRYSTQLP
jgi:hypothetical protein